MNNNRYSDAKIVWFPEKLAAMRENRITAPIYVRVKPTNRCNHACAWCAYGHGDIEVGMHDDMDARDMIPRAKMLEVLWDFQEMGVRAVTFSGGGEPLSYPHITEAMALCHNYKIDLSCITNGSLLEKQRAEVLYDAKWIRVSIDYTNEREMAGSRNIPEDQFARIMGNMAAFAKSKRGCELGINFIVTKTSYIGLADFCGKLKDIGVENIRISPVWLPNFTEYHAPISIFVQFEIEKAMRHADKNFAVYSSYNLGNPAHSRERTFDRCYFTEMVPVVGADQTVYHCHNVAYAEHGIIGSIKTQRFKELWFGDEAKAAFARLNPAKHCQHQCAAHHKNEMIDGFMNATDNFV